MTPERWAEIEELFHRTAESEPQHRKAILDDRTLYPDAAMEARLYPGNEATPELDRLRTRTWTRIKTNR